LGNYGSLINQGTITLAGGAQLHLRGNFTPDAIGAVTNSNGTVFIEGTVTNVGSFAVAPSFGTAVLDGTIVGGTIVGGGLSLRGGTLSGVSYLGPLDLSADFSRVTVNNGISLMPQGGGPGPGSALVTGALSVLSFAVTQTLSNAGVLLGGTDGTARLQV